MSAPTTTLCQLCQDGVDYRYGDLVVTCGVCGGTGQVDAPWTADELAESREMAAAAESEARCWAEVAR